MGFAGFERDTITFLGQLEKKNDKAFFDSNKERFERVWTEPARHFVIEVGKRIQKFAPTIQFEPKVGGTMMRMNRDIRFSKDKSPYKTHLDLWFWDGDEKGWGRPGFFFRMTKNQLMCGAGMHGFEKDALARYRQAVDDPKTGASLAKIVASLRTAGIEVGQEGYKKVPKGYDPDHPRAELLRFGGLHAAVNSPIPAELTTPKFVDLVVQRFKSANPLRAWLADALA